MINSGKEWDWMDKKAEPKEELLQGNLVKDLPKDEILKPKKKKKPPSTAWGVPGGGRSK